MTHTIYSLSDTIVRSGIPVNDIVTYLETILVLRKKYGKKIYHTDMIDLIKKAEPWVASLLHLLIVYNIIENNDIKQLCRAIKQQSKQYISQFNVFIPKEKYLTPIQEKLEKKFPHSKVNKQTNIDVGIEITWEWRHYKRNLDQDIEKLLG